MTALGKILVFVVLILALVWNALTVNTYVTRTNWKTELDATRKALAETTVAASRERDESNKVKASTSASVTELRAENTRLKDSETALSKAVDDAKKKLDEVAKTEAAVQTRDDVARGNVDLTRKQVEILQTELSASETARNNAIIRGQKDKNDKLQAELDADARQRKVDDLEGKLLIARDPERGAGGVGAIRPQADKDFRAVVSAVQGDTVVINLGANAKLLVGTELQISRYEPEGKFIGSIIITSVDPFHASGRFKGLVTVSKPGPDDLPRKGDTVNVLP